MNYVVPSRTLRNLKSICVQPNSLYYLVRCKTFSCQGLVVACFNLQVLSVNRNPIVNVGVSCLFNMKRDSFVAHAYEDIVDMVVHCSYSMEPSFCGGGVEFVVVIKVYGTWIKAIETSIRGEFVGSSGCGIVGKFCER